MGGRRGGDAPRVARGSAVLAGRADDRPARRHSRRAAAPQACGLRRDLRPRHGAVARARARARGRRDVLLRRERQDQRVHGRVPDPEPLSGARRGRRAVVVVRPGLHRPPREGQEARLACCVDALLADAARPDGPDGDLHPRRAVGDRHLRRIRGTTRRSRSASPACSSRSSRCSVSPGSSSGSSTATTISPSPRSRRCSGTSRSSSGS